MREIPLTQGKVALVDDEDFDRANQFKWYAVRSRRTFYAMRAIPAGKRKQVHQRLHTFLFPELGLLDHRDGDGLNNQRQNLRPATEHQNTFNARKTVSRETSSRFKGVRWRAPRSCWTAYITFDRHQIYLGQFDSEEDAALAYDYAAKIYFGEFAWLNFP